MFTPVPFTQLPHIPVPSFTQQFEQHPEKCAVLKYQRRIPYFKTTRVLFLNHCCLIVNGEKKIKTPYKHKQRWLPTKAHLLTKLKLLGSVPRSLLPESLPIAHCTIHIQQNIIFLKSSCCFPHVNKISIWFSLTCVSRSRLMIISRCHSNLGSDHFRVSACGRAWIIYGSTARWSYNWTVFEHHQTKHHFFCIFAPSVVKNNDLTRILFSMNVF